MANPPVIANTTQGYYYSSSPSTAANQSYIVNFTTTAINPSNSINRGLASSVRCFKDTTPKHIELTAEITSANQTVTVNKYFANDYTINR